MSYCSLEAIHYLHEHAEEDPVEVRQLLRNLSGTSDCQITKSAEDARLDVPARDRIAQTLNEVEKKLGHEGWSDLSQIKVSREVSYGLETCDHDFFIFVIPKSKRCCAAEIFDFERVTLEQ